jgi:hypothetical protein
MVGAAIVSITLIGMYQAIVESAAHNRMAEDRRIALMLAQSEMAAVGVLIPVQPGTSEGTAGDYYWRVDIQPYGAVAQPTLGQAPNPAGTLCLVSVQVDDSRRKPLATLNTLMLSRGG